MRGAEDQGRGCAVPDQLVAEHLGDHGRVGRIGEGLLGREGMTLQPVQQLGAEGGDHLGLHIVDVAVDEARGDQCVRMVSDYRAFGQAVLQVGPVPDRLDQSVAADHGAVGHMDKRFTRIGQEGVGPQPDQRAAQHPGRAAHRGGSVWNGHQLSCARRALG